MDTSSSTGMNSLNLYKPTSGNYTRIQQIVDLTNENLKLRGIIKCLTKNTDLVTQILKKAKQSQQLRRSLTQMFFSWDESWW